MQESIENVKEEVAEVPEGEDNKMEDKKTVLEGSENKMEVPLEEEVEKEAEDFTPNYEKARKKRLEYLLNQAQKFSRFMGHSLEEAANPDPDSDDDDPVFEFNESPHFIQGQMKHYQVSGLNWLIKLYDNSINGILGDEMGLGKTLQTISMLGYLFHHLNIKGKHLIIAPKSTINNWCEEFKKWCPVFRVVGYYGNKIQRHEIERKFLKTRRFDVLITNFDNARLHLGVFKPIKWHYIVVDEGHQRLKNENSKFSKQLRRLTSMNRLILTGTPLQNNLHELWALLNFLLPDIFNSSEDFDSWFDTSTVLSSGETLIERLHTILRPFLLRRTKALVEVELLPKVEYKLYTGITELQRELYIKSLKREFSVFNPATCKSYEVWEPSQIFMNLRKICNHPYLLSGVDPEPHLTDEKLVNVCGKMQLLDKLLAMLMEQGSRALIFTQFVIMLNVLEDYLTMRGYKFCRLDGNTSYEDRANDMSNFNKENSDVFVYLLSTRAGGLGVNLHSADTVIIYDSDWNPQVDIQAEDRAHRIGQKKQVRIFRLISENTVDERIVQRAAVKLRLDRKVIQEGRLLEKDRLKKGEMQRLLNADKDYILKTTKATIRDETILETIQRSQEKAQILEACVESSDITLDNFETIFQFDGKNYENYNEEKSSAFFRDVKSKYQKDETFTISDDEEDQVPVNALMSATASEDKKIVENVESFPNNQQFLRFLGISNKIKQEPGSNKLQPPEIHDFQFYDPKLINLLEMEHYHFLKRRTNKDHLDSLTADDPELQEKVDNSAALSTNDLIKKKRFLDAGFAWTKDEFDQFVKVVKIHGRSNLNLIANNILTKSLDQVKSYSDAFWTKFCAIEDDKLQRMCFRKLWMEWKPQLEKILEKCNNNFNEMPDDFCFQVGFSQICIRRILEKVWKSNGRNLMLFKEIYQEMRRNLNLFCIQWSEKNLKVTEDNIGKIIDHIIYTVKKNAGIKDPNDLLMDEETESGVGTNSNSNSNDSQESRSDLSCYEPDSSGNDSDFVDESSFGFKRTLKKKIQKVPIKRKIEEDQKENILRLPPLKIPKLEPTVVQMPKAKNLVMSNVRGCAKINSYFNPQPGPSSKVSPMKQRLDGNVDAFMIPKIEADGN